MRNTFLIVILVLLVECSPKVANITLPYDIPENFSNSGEIDPPEQWWIVFEDERLNTIMDSAMDSNLSLTSVWYQIVEAQALLDQSSSFLKPDIDLQLQSGISRPRPDFVGGENTQLSLRTSYEVDLWGRIRYNVHADHYRLQASYFDYKTTAIALSGEIAVTWFRILAVNDQMDLIDEQITINQQMLSLIRARFNTGQVRGVDILRQRQLIESTRSQKLILEAQLEVLKIQLSILSGHPPDFTMELDTGQLPFPPRLPDVGVPLELINRRPDIQSAFNQLQAADRQKAAAISARYPRLNFSLAGAIRSNTYRDLLQSQAVSLSGSLLAPLYYGNRLNAAVDQAEAIRQQRVYEYGQTVITAFQEVENALIQETRQLERIDLLNEQIDLADRTYRQLRIEYLNGSSEYLDILTAIDQEQQLQRNLITAKMGLLEIRIGLYRALAGGFTTSRETL